MNLINPSFEILEQPSGLDGIYKMIEIAGRTCYKSHDRITADSAKGFVERMINSEHGAMLEHGTIYLKLEPKNDGSNYSEYMELQKYSNNPYSRFKSFSRTVSGYYSRYEEYSCYVTTNLRVLVENGWMDDLKYLCEPTEFHERRYTVRFVSDIHFYKDTTRHRVFSWAIESTRLCNYIKERFGSSVSFLTPIWLKEDEKDEFEEDLKTIESIYFKWINKGWQPQQAAYFLIQGTKAEIVMTGFASDYIHFFDLRSETAKTGKAHPSIIELVEPLKQEFIKRKYVEYGMV